MKTVLFTNSVWSIPLLLKLEETKSLGGIVLTDLKNQENFSITSFANSRDIPLVEIAKGDLGTKLAGWLKQVQPKLGICLAFPYRFPKEVIELPTYGIVNFHFGSLPRFAGPDPLFWTLKERQDTTVLTAHRMTEHLDHGPVLLREQLTIFPGENYGLLGARLSQLSSSVVQQLFDKVTAPTGAEPRPAQETLSQKRPTLTDLAIDWQNQSSDQIEALVNAANPAYGGAITYYKNAMVRILEVSPADVSNAALLGPGTIVHSDPYDGLFVLCSDYKFLRINIIKTPEAIMTGFKIAALGIRKNDKFMSHTNDKDREPVMT